MKMNSQIKKGIIEMFILKVLENQDMYGYDLIKHFQLLLHEMNESNIYSILRRLKQQQYLDTYIGEESNGPQRTYYKITDSGTKYLNDLLQDWKELNDLANSIGIKN